MPAKKVVLPAIDYDLAATLDSGQVFRWQRSGEVWRGMVGRRLVSLAQGPEGIHAVVPAPVENWDWLQHFLQTEIDYATILKTFPDDEPMRRAVAACRGLRLLRQDPWECLASFILSSTKQIVQIRQIVAQLGERFGEPCASGGDASSPVPRAFPTAERIAAASEADLRACKMGFRATGLLGAARAVAEGQLDLEKIRQLDYAGARSELMQLHGVGGKIADCVLLFAYGFDGAFPVDVWVERALQELYFSRRRATDQRLRRFAVTHFGPHAGYAQQFLFHYVRVKRG